MCMAEGLAASLASPTPLIAWPDYDNQIWSQPLQPCSAMELTEGSCHMPVQKCSNPADMTNLSLYPYSSISFTRIMHCTKIGCAFTCPMPQFACPVLDALIFFSMFF